MRPNGLLEQIKGRRRIILAGRRRCRLDCRWVHGAGAGSRVIERKYTNIAPENNATSSPSSSHILGRDGAPTPKHPQSRVSPLCSADANAVKKITEMTAPASA